MKKQYISMFLCVMIVTYFIQTVTAMEKVTTIIVPPTFVYDKVYSKYGAKMQNYGMWDDYNVEGIVVAISGNKYGFLNQYGEMLTPSVFDASEYGYTYLYFSDGMMEVAQDGKYGFVNAKGELAVPCVYDYVYPFEYGIAAVSQDNKWGFINKNGQEIVPCVYDDVGYDFSDGMKSVKQGEKYGFVNQGGQLSIPCIYDDVRWFVDGIAAVRLGDKWGYINKVGQTEISFVFDDVSYISDDIFSVKQDGKWGYIDSGGQFIIPCAYDSYFSFGDDGLATVRQDGQYGIINRSGEFILPCIYNQNDFRTLSYGVSYVKQGSKYGFIDRNGIWLTSFDFDGLGEDFSAGLLDVYQNNKRGLMNQYGELVFPCNYDYYSIGRFSDELLMIKQDGKWGLIDYDAREVVPHIYDYILPLYNGLAVVEQDGKYGYIDQSGQLITPCTYDDYNGRMSTRHVGGDLPIVEQNGLIGLVDNISGQEIIPCSYEDIRKITESVYWVLEDGKWGIVDIQERNFTLSATPEKTVSGYLVPVTVKNTDGQSQTKTVIAAIYSNNKFLGMNKATITLLPDGQQDISLDVSTLQTGAYIKLFVWNDDGQTLEPYDTPLVLPLGGKN